MTRALMIMLAGLVLAACAALHTGSDFDHATDFSRYHSFAWLPGAHHGGRNPLNVRRVREAVESELGGKGFVLATDPAQADMLVNFTIGSRERTDVSTYPVGFRGPWRWGAPYFGNAVDIHTYREGTLAIDVFDGRSRQPFWHGWAKKQLSQSDQASPEAPLRAAVAAILVPLPRSAQPVVK